MTGSVGRRDGVDRSSAFPLSFRSVLRLRSLRDGCLVLTCQVNLSCRVVLALLRSTFFINYYYASG